MKQRKYRYFSADFETTVYDGQEFTEVWASGCVELFTEDVVIHNSLPQLMEYLLSQHGNLIAYFHNLKFDGAFWLSYLLVDLKLKQAYTVLDADSERPGVKWLAEKDMPNNTFKYSISDNGLWYNIVIKMGGRIIELRDSYKLLPFSVKTIGESFKTKHKKLDMNYKGFRYAGCTISDEEKSYIANDVLVVKEALEIMFNEGHSSLTIGSCCLAEFKKIIGRADYEMFFPDIYELPLDKNLYGYENFGQYIRKSYRGGWCYVAKGKEGKIFHNGSTLDVCSLYPSMMHSESGNRYPIGLPHVWKGGSIPDEALGWNKYYFVRIKTRFYLKEGMLPFIQIKNSLLYRGTEMLETSDVKDRETGEYTRYTIGRNGELKDTRIEMVLTMTDYQLLLDHYELVDFEILDGVWFFSEIGIFDDYINTYKHKKQTSTGALRELAKLFLNNLYGKLASSDCSSFKVAIVKPDGSIGFYPVSEHEKKPGFIPCGSAITSYSRNFTIRTAQKNYYGPDKPGFIYSDTDSIHCDLPTSEIQGVVLHDKNFCCWKPESEWDEAIFSRQKTYIEHIVMCNLEPVKPYYDIKCAGMPNKCKQLFEMSMVGEKEGDWNTEEIKFLSEKRTLNDFNIGLEVPGKLMPKRIKGGIVLVDTTYKMH